MAVEEVWTSRTFLLGCLRDSGLEEDLVEDVCDVCVTAGCNALDLAENTWSTAEVEKKLFLTGREASQLMACCRRKCGKGEGGAEDTDCSGESENQSAEGDGFSADRESTTSGNISMMTMTMTMTIVPSFEELHVEKRPQSTESSIDGNSPRLKSSYLECSKWPADTSVPSQLESSWQHSPPPPSHRPCNDSRSTNMYLDPPNSGSSTCSVRVVPQLNKHPVPGGPLSIQKTVEDWLKRNSPELIEKKLVGGPTGRDSDIGKKFTFRSHLQSTAASLAKQKCSQTETVSARQVDKPKGPRAISSRLLRPTHSSQMRATGTTNMNIDKDGSGRPLTSEQIAYIEATKQRNQVRNRRKSEMAKLEFPKQRSSRRDSQADCSQSQSSYDHSMRTTKNKPFFLRSQSRHEQAVRQFRDQVASEYQAEVTAREFKAKSYRPLKPPRSMSAPVEKRVTLAQAPRLLSERRAQHWAKNIKPVRDQKEELQRKWEEDKKRSEEIAMARILKTSRQALTHHARPMPDFSKVFKPDLTLAVPPTKPKSPKLASGRLLRQT